MRHTSLLLQYITANNILYYHSKTRMTTGANLSVNTSHCTHKENVQYLSKKWSTDSPQNFRSIPDAGIQTSGLRLPKKKCIQSRKVWLLDLNLNYLGIRCHTVPEYTIPQLYLQKCQNQELSTFWSVFFYEIGSYSVVQAVLELTK